MVVKIFELSLTLLVAAAVAIFLPQIAPSLMKAEAAKEEEVSHTTPSSRSRSV